MILQELNKLYDRLVDEPAYAIAPAGYSLQKIAFTVVIHDDGQLHAIIDQRDHSSSKPAPMQRLVPGQAKPSGSGLNPCFLWDNSAYMLGYAPPQQSRETATDYEKRIERTGLAFEAFRDRHLKLEQEINNPSFSAVCQFLMHWQPEKASEYSVLKDISSGFGVFQLIGETKYVHEYTVIQAWWEQQQDLSKPKSSRSMCLITGQRSPPALLHEPAIKGVSGAQSSGAKLVSFNCDSFTSYDKEQSKNAPVSETATFRYCTALNGILSGPNSNKHRLSLADTTIVFWTDKPTATESWLGALFSNDLLTTQPQDEARLQQVGVLLKALREGGKVLWDLGDDPFTPFFLLGLAPNAARLSVRFWYTDTLGHLFDRLQAHHDALKIVAQFGSDSRKPDPEFPPAWMLLRETAREAKDIPPLLAGALMRAILQGTPYPDSLASAVIRRIRADRTINYCRAAILKAWLTRLNRSQGEIPVSLDTERIEPAYRLGRLFAVMEKTQEDALPGINATVRDRFYSAASATPAAVFPRLLRTYQHHLAKLVPGAKVNREKLVQEIVDGLDTMPPH
ncbi:MAG: type I-C CRISPR-associated protein Cas8c/Csd1, partial [Gammaproteobacteria bacterium]|nr:type I-C CRISPR-associated protein Cas8c/Csd1 [Gammaproteobacteria bacterium]